MLRSLRDNGLSLFFLALFAVTLVAQSFVGQREFNSEQVAHGAAPVSWTSYVLSSEFGEAVMENWQSEFLQFSLFIFATVWLVQRGSNESKNITDAGPESDEQQKVGAHANASSPGWAKAGGWRTTVYSNSLILVMTLIFIGTWTIQSITAWRVWNTEHIEHGEETASWASYVASADFWEKTFQNWQSEFLAVGTLAIFTVYLRQRGSPESKPVGEAHDTTAASG